MEEYELAASSLLGFAGANVTFARLNADTYKDAARKYGGTHRYPTFEWFPEGQKVAFFILIFTCH